jgi:hypothetical protein
MSWICPKCNRQFKHATDYHSCVKVDVKTHFNGKSPGIKKIYDRILKEVKKFGKVNVSPVQSSIMLKNVSTFLGLRVAKGWVEIDFFLPEETHDFPIHKTMRYTKKKTIHYVRLESAAQVDKQLVQWIKTSYEMAGAK